MSIEFKDLTGKLIPVRDYEDAIDVVRKFVVAGMMKFPPEFAVQLPNILRCLEQGCALTRIVETQRKEGT